MFSALYSLGLDGLCKISLQRSKSCFFYNKKGKKK